jgi:hypothetical protein
METDEDREMAHIFIVPQEIPGRRVLSPKFWSFHLSDFPLFSFSVVRNV